MSTNYDIAANFADNYNETYFHWLEDTIQESLSDEQIIEKFKIYEPFWNEEDIRFNEIQALRQELSEIKAFINMDDPIASTLNADELIIPGKYNANSYSTGFPNVNKSYNLDVSYYMFIRPLIETLIRYLIKKSLNLQRLTIYILLFKNFDLRSLPLILQRYKGLSKGKIICKSPY